MTKYFGYKYLVNWPEIIEVYENPLGTFIVCYTQSVLNTDGNKILYTLRNTHYANAILSSFEAFASPSPLVVKYQPKINSKFWTII